MPGHMVIRRHRPWIGLFWWLGSSLVLVLAGFAYHQSEMQQVQLESLELEHQSKSVQSRTEELETEVQTLRKRLVSFERERQVEERANESLTSHLKSLQERILELEQDVAFYRGMLQRNARDIRIQSLSIVPPEDGESGSGAYRFALVLTRLMTEEEQISGTVAIMIDGVAGDANERVEPAIGDGEEPVAFEFKHFQRLDGEFTLPAGFEPIRAVVRVSLSGKKAAKSERSFAWSLAIAKPEG